MSRWDLARARSQQPARRYKPVGPVGEVPVGDDHDMVMRTPISLLADQDYCACGDCGYHVCSCKPEYVPHVFRPPPTPPAPSIRGRLPRAAGRRLLRLRGEAVSDYHQPDYFAQVKRLTAERDTLQNEVYDLKHVIQHWEVDAEGLKDDLTELREAALALLPSTLLSQPDYAAIEWRRIEALRVVLAKLKP
jgi:hypothetical protein